MSTSEITRAPAPADAPNEDLDWTAAEDWDPERDTNLSITYRDET
jgi:hypothetical protein